MLPLETSGSNGAPRSKRIEQPDLAAGITGEDSDLEGKLIRRYPYLARPGPQPWNSDVAPTLQDQLAKVFQPRPARPLSRKAVGRLIATIQAHRDELRPALLDLLAEDIGIIIGRILDKIGNGSWKENYSRHLNVR